MNLRTLIVAGTALVLGTLLLPTTGSAANVELLVGYRPQGEVLRFDADSGAYLGVFAEVAWPLHMASGPTGSLHIVDFGDNSIQERDLPSGSLLNSFVIPPLGGSPPLSFLAAPVGITFGPDGMLYTSSYHHDRIYRYTPSGVPASNGVFPLAMPLDDGADLEFGPDGLLYVTATDGIRRFDPLTGLQVDPSVFAPKGEFTFGADGSLFVTLDDRVNRYAAGTGVALGSFVSAGSGGLAGATDLSFGPHGNLFVVSHDLAGVLEYDGMTGDYLRAIMPPAGYSAPQDLFFYAIPEPGPLSLASAAMGAFALFRRGRTTANVVR